MAGQMCGPILDSPADRAGASPTGRPTASSPITSPTRCWRRTAASSSTRSLGGRGSRHRVGRRRRPLLLHRRHGRVRGRRLPHRAAGPVDARERAGRRDPLRRSRLAGGARPRGGAQAARAHVNRVGHAFFKTRMRDEGAAFGGEVSGHYYFRDFYCADSGTLPALLILELLRSGSATQRAAGPAARALLHLGRDQLGGGRPGREDGGARAALLRRRGHLAGRRLGRLRGLALQRPPVQHRAAAAAEPGVVGLAEHMEAKRDEVLALIRA